MATQQTVKAYVSGTHNLLPDEVIPKDAASYSLNWITRDGRIELVYGRQIIGAAGGIGKSYGEHTGYKVNGTPVRFRKVNTKIQYLNGSTWTDVITGLTETADYTFSNYQSLAGSFVYIFGRDGIYKIVTANPGSYSSLYNSAKNFKGYGLIDQGRSILWGIQEDPTGFRYSWIDNQRGVSGSTGVYTSVSAEATTSLTGTLAFKAGGATRTCFGVSITITASGQVFTDDYNGNLVGSLGGTGTINYTTGAYTLSASGVGTANYQWEDSNTRGVTDFTYSATRLAGEGNILRQDIGGDPIKVVIPIDGQYFSLKENSAYQVSLDSTDLAPTNQVFRTDIGVKTLRSATGTGQGIVFVNTANPSRPRLEILRRNPLGDNFDVSPLFPQFKFDNFDFDDALVDTWDEYVIVGCKEGSDENNRLLLCNVKNNTVDTTNYGIRTSTKVDGVLYGGDVVSQTTYELFTGFDDVGAIISNGWESNGETYGDDVLKKVKRFRFQGRIDPAQSIGVYAEFDNASYQLIGTILGDGSYVDAGSSFAIGTSYVGESAVGGESTTTVSRFFIELKVRTPKFRKRKLKFVALGYGYASIDQMTDFDIWTYQQKLPSRYRVKQNVDLSGSPTDEANPDY